MGGVIIEGHVSTGMLLLGYLNLGTQSPYETRTVWNVTGQVIIKGKRIDVGRGSKLSVGGSLRFGDHSTITGNSSIICHNSVSLGDDVLISWETLIMDTDFHSILKDGKVLNQPRPIIINDHVWIGCRCTILKGTTIPSNSIIAAGSLITGVMRNEFCIYSSNQKVIREDVSWKR